MQTKQVSLGLAEQHGIIAQIGITSFYSARGVFDVTYKVDGNSDLCYHDARLVKLVIDGSEYPLTPIQATVLEVALEKQIKHKLESTL